MDQENQNTKTLLNSEIGNIEQEKKTLKAAVVTIASVLEEKEKPDGTPFKLPLIKVMVKHPEKDELISISKIKNLDKDKIITRSLWGQTDKEGNIQKGSAIDTLLTHLHCDRLVDIEGKAIDTVVESDDSPFLCLKAY